MTTRRRWVACSGLLAAVTITATAWAANPFASTERAKWKTLAAVGTIKKVRFQSSTCKLRMTNKAAGKLWLREADSRKVRMNNGGLECKSGQGNCIKQRHRPIGGGPWSAVQNVAAMNLNQAPSTSSWATSLRCHPWTIPAPSGLSWSWRSGDPAAMETKTIGISGDKHHATDTGVGGGAKYGVCRVLVQGATFVGTMRDTTSSSVRVFQGGKWITKSVSGNKTVCSVNDTDNSATEHPSDFFGRNYFNFEYLRGSISLSRWTTSTSQAATIGTVDGRAAFLCLRKWHYSSNSNSNTKTLRAFGFRKDNSSTCWTPRAPKLDDWPAPSKTTRLLKK